MAGERLERDLGNSMIAGVCAGIARRYDIDVTLVRVVVVLFTVLTAGIGVPLYVAAWIVMPRAQASAPAPAASAAAATPESVAEEMRRVSERLAEAARVLADKTREAAEEIAEIARRPAHPSGATPPESPVHDEPWQPPVTSPPTGPETAPPNMPPGPQR